jgi:hypothetical protein
MEETMTAKNISTYFFTATIATLAMGMAPITLAHPQSHEQSVAPAASCLLEMFAEPPADLSVSTNPCVQHMRQCMSWCCY